MFDLSETLSPHLVASVLKKYLRDRPFATVPYRCYRSAMLIHESLTDKYAPFSAEECKSFIMNIPGEKQLLFITITRFVFSSKKNPQASKVFLLFICVFCFSLCQQVLEEDLGF